jgi:hypothetical protein
LPFVPIEATKLALLGPRAHALQGFAGLIAAAYRSGRHQARDFLPVARDRDLFALLDEVEQLAELVLGFEGTDLAHRPSRIKPAQASLTAFENQPARHLRSTPSGFVLTESHATTASIGIDELDAGCSSSRYGAAAKGSH